MYKEMKEDLLLVQDNEEVEGYRKCTSKKEKCLTDCPIGPTKAFISDID